jgi:hypothetical protein
MNDRLVHVDQSVTALLVIAEMVAAKVEETRVRDGLGSGALAAFERRQRHERLEGRSRRIGAVQCPVEQRLVGRIVEQRPVIAADAIDEQIGVEGRGRDEGENAAGRRLDRHQRPAAVAKSLFGHLLQLDVERQGQIIALHRVPYATDCERPGHRHRSRPARSRFRRAAGIRTSARYPVLPMWSVPL